MKVLLALALLHAGFASAAVITAREAVQPPAPGPNDPAGFEVVWSGIYTVPAIRRVDDPKAPAQSRGIVVGAFTPVLERATWRIPAKAGTNFGVAFRFRDASEENPIDYRAVWRFPLPGLTNPKNKNTFLEYESAPSLCQGDVCVYGWSFSERWEMVIGTWTLELWRGARRLHEQTFQVMRPGSEP